MAFNRPDALRRSLTALAAADLASDTDLFIRIDGPRNEADAEKVAAVREVAKSARGFRSVDVCWSDKNQGLGPSIIQGVERILDFSETVIVLEDDLVVSKGFLRYMNDALRLYADDKRVFSVCGYTNRVDIPEGYTADAYFAPRSSSWGWATWRDRWQSVDWNPSPASLQKNALAFNRWGGSDCAKMLRDWIEGRNRSWAIRFCYSQFLQGKTALFPVRSLVDPSAGFEGDGTNCRRYNRFKFDFDPEGKSVYRFPEKVEEIPSILRSALRYHSLGRRLWSRLMYVFYG
ncbi:MAG: glycosyltransferase [Bacteroidales bacterium]|nr:glycosyltransferase [Bacteroidales bacterium]